MSSYLILVLCFASIHAQDVCRNPFNPCRVGAELCVPASNTAGYECRPFSPCASNPCRRFERCVPDSTNTGFQCIFFSTCSCASTSTCDDSFIIPRCVPLTCAQFRCPGNAEDCEEGFSGFPTCVRRECSATKCSKGEQCFVSLDTEAGDHECLPATGVTVPESSEIIEAEDAFNRYLLTKPVSASQAAEECSRFEMQHEDIATQLVFDGVRIVMEAWKNFGRIESGALKEVWVRGTSSARPGARLNSLTYSTMPYPADSRLCVVMSYYHPVDTRTRRVNLYASSSCRTLKPALCRGFAGRDIACPTIPAEERVYFSAGSKSPAICEVTRRACWDSSASTKNCYYAHNKTSVNIVSDTEFEFGGKTFKVVDPANPVNGDQVAEACSAASGNGKTYQVVSLDFSNFHQFRLGMTRLLQERNLPKIERYMGLYSPIEQPHVIINTLSLSTTPFSGPHASMCVIGSYYGLNPSEEFNLFSYNCNNPRRGVICESV